VTLYLHEVHRVVGTREDDFEAAYRDTGGWMHSLACDNDARLLYYLSQAHGTGPSYRVITLTAITDGAAWERLARRVQTGDLNAWAAHTDTLRHDTTAKLLLPVTWSPLQDLDLTTIAAAPIDHEPTLFMEDTMWPLPGQLAGYLQAAGTHYTALLNRPAAILELILGLQTALGAERGPEVVLWQKLRDNDRLIKLLATDVPPELRAPGTWMHDALTFREEWESRLLRTSRWSPWA